MVELSGGAIAKLQWRNTGTISSNTIIPAANFVQSCTGANLSLSEYSVPSPSHANKNEDVNFSVRANNLGTLNAQPDITLSTTYNQDVNITSAMQNNGVDFNCSPSSGLLTTGSAITCTMTSTLVSGAANKDFSFVVKATALGQLTQTSVIASPTIDTNSANNTLVTTVPINSPAYCQTQSLLPGFHMIDPDAGSNKNSFEIFCYEDASNVWHDLIALPIKNNSNNFLFNNNATSSNYYDTTANPRTHFEAIEINANSITYSGTLNDGTPRPQIPVVISPNAAPYTITTDGKTYHVMGSSFSNISLIGTPFKIDWDNTGELSGCDETKLRKAFGQAVKYNTINAGTTNDGLSRCEISSMQLTLLDDYQFLTYGTGEVLQHSCKEMATYIPNNIFDDASVDGHFNILTTQPSYPSSIPTTNGERDNGQDIGATLRPLTVYCKYQTDLAYVWTFLTALDAKVTQYKTDLVTKQDTCSQLGLYFYVPNSKETFDRVRQYLKAKKTGNDGWENYTGTIEEKIKSLHAGNVYYLTEFKDVKIWPYGPFGVYLPSPKSKTSSLRAPMHNITTMANYNDSMGKDGWLSILSSADLNKTEDWWIADIGAGLEITKAYADHTYSPSGVHPTRTATYDEPNGNYTYDAWLNFLYDEEGWVYHNDDWYANYPYYDYMCMSETNYDTASRYSLIPGFFDVIQRSRNIPPQFSDSNLSTQIVRKNIELDVILYKINTTTLLIDKTQLNEDENKSVGIFISSVVGGNSPVPIKFLGEYHDFSTNNGRIPITDFNLTSANPRLLAQFYYCNAANTDWTTCWNYNNNPDSPTISAIGGGDHSDSNDDFAIRPDKFGLSVSGSIITKAEDINITYYAYDYTNAPTTNYNETLSTFNAPLADSTKIPLCPVTALSFPAITFVNGIDTNTTSLVNIGAFHVEIKENSGSEYAIVDLDDTPDIERFITPSDMNLTIVPHHFKITPITNINHGNNFTYLSNDLDNMAIKFDFNATAENSSNNITPNYTALCYAHDTNISLQYNSANISTQLAKLFYKELTSGVDANITATANNVANALPASIFTTDVNGTAQIKLRVNFSRENNTTINPFIVNFNDLNISDQTYAASGIITATDSSSAIDANATMVYGRSHASRQRYEVPKDTPYPANIYYESYCFGTDIGGADCNKTLLNGFSPNYKKTDDVRWFINEVHNTALDGNVTTVVEKGGTNILADIVDATDNPTGNPSPSTLTYDASRGYPYKTTMENNASSWLIYNEGNPTATRNQFSVEFNIGGTNWSGAHETNTTTNNPATATTNRRTMW